MTWRDQDLGEHCIEIAPAVLTLLETVEADPR